MVNSTLEVLLHKTLTVSLGGKTREISAEEALQQRLFKDALAGKRTAMREVVKWIIKREALLKKSHPGPPLPRKVTQHISPDPDNADEALVLLGIAAPNPVRADIGADRAQLLLEPWAVEAALHRERGGANLDDDERAAVRRCTRNPDALALTRKRDT
ncbi:hypothetical protein UNPF46_15355 [Bradyrhizobium sp. UNPF46]|nr:hypothetical protein UNPF46_15355 [Bradyrhizobium sp. UNPF46]